MIIFCSEKNNESFFDRLLVIFHDFKNFIESKISNKTSEPKTKDLSSESLEIVRNVRDNLENLVKTLTTKDNDSSHNQKNDQIISDLVSKLGSTMEILEESIKSVGDSNSQLKDEMKRLKEIVENSKKNMDDVTRKLSDLYNANVKKEVNN
jgi:hypothetical protein